MFDHCHWSITNDKSVDSKMGTCSDLSSNKNSGKIFFIGRGSNGVHEQLYGPITKKKYRALKKQNKLRGIVENLPYNCHE